MKKEITERDGALFAEFMGWKYYNDVECYETPHIICKADDLCDAKIEDWTSTIKPEDMKFNSSWDWLMPVIGKIWAMNEYRHFVDETSGQFENKIDIDTNINHTYPTVVEFIKWYNEQEKDETK